MSEPATPPRVGSGTGTRPARRTFAPTVVIGGAGGALASVGATRAWITTGSAETATLDPVPGGTPVDLVGTALSGADINPLIGALALVALASWGAVLVLRGGARRAVAALGGLASLGALTAYGRTVVGADLATLSNQPPGAQSWTIWPLVTAIALLVSAAAFAVAVRDASRWPTMSSRYDAPVAGGSRSASAAVDLEDEDPRAVWRALDDGEDPTA